MKKKMVAIVVFISLIGFSACFAQTSQQPVTKQGDATASPLFRKSTGNNERKAPQATVVQATPSPLYGKAKSTAPGRRAAKSAPMATSAPTVKKKKSADATKKDVLPLTGPAEK